MKWAGLRMGYRETHPNFDDAASIERLLALGFDDDSVFGEGWPALRRGGVVVYIDYISPTERCAPAGARFSLESLDGEALGQAEDIDALIAFLRDLDAPREHAA